MLSFLGDVSIGLWSFTTALYTAMLVAGLGMDPATSAFWIGMVPTGWGITYTWSPVLLGHVSDKIGRKKSVFIGMGGFIVVNVLVLTLVTHPAHLLVAFVAAGFLFGFYFPVLGASTSELAGPLGWKQHSRALGKFMIAWSIGLTFGPLIGGIFSAFLDHLAGYMALIGVAASIIAITAAFMPSPASVSEIVGAMNDTANDGGLSKKMRQGDDVGLPGLPTWFASLSIIGLATVFAFNNQILFTIFPAFALDVMALGPAFHAMDTSFVIGLVTFFLGLGRTGTFTHAGHVRAKRRKYYVLLMPAGAGVMMLLVTFYHLAEGLALVFLVYGACSGYCFALGLIMTMEFSERGKGLRAGVYETIIGIGMLSATLVSSFIGQLDSASPFLLGALVSIGISALLAVAIAIAAIKVRKKKPACEE